MKPFLTETQLNNVRTNYPIIQRFICDELEAGLRYQDLNRLAHRLSKAKEEPTPENIETASALVDEIFNKHFLPEILKTEPSPQKSIKISQEFQKLYEKNREDGQPVYDLDSIDGRTAILSDLITALECFPKRWDKTSRIPSFPTGELPVIDDVLYINRGPRKPERLPVRGTFKIQCEFDVGQFLAEIITEKMAFLLPILSLKLKGIDVPYWEHQKIFPVNADESIRVEFLDEFVKNGQGETLAQLMRLTLYNRETEETQSTHTLWFSRLLIDDEGSFNLDASGRNFFRWLFKLLLADKAKGRVHCSSSIGRTGVWCWLYKAYASLLQPENYALLQRFLFGEKLTLDECKKIADVFIQTLNELRKVRPFIQSEIQLITTPQQLFLMLAEEFQQLTEKDIKALQSILVTLDTPVTPLIFSQIDSLAKTDTASEDDDAAVASSPAAKLPQSSDKYLVDGASTSTCQKNETVVIPARFSVAQCIGIPPVEPANSSAMPDRESSPVAKEKEPAISAAPSTIDTEETVATNPSHEYNPGFWESLRRYCCCGGGNLAQVADETLPDTTPKPVW